MDDDGPYPAPPGPGRPADAAAPPRAPHGPGHRTGRGHPGPRRSEDPAPGTGRRGPPTRHRRRGPRPLLPRPAPPSPGPPARRRLAGQQPPNPWARNPRPPSLDPATPTPRPPHHRPPHRRPPHRRPPHRPRPPVAPRRPATPAAGAHRPGLRAGPGDGRRRSAYPRRPAAGPSTAELASAAERVAVMTAADSTTLEPGLSPPTDLSDVAPGLLSRALLATAAATVAPGSGHLILGRRRTGAAILAVSCSGWPPWSGWCCWCRDRP